MPPIRSRSRLRSAFSGALGIAVLCFGPAVDSAPAQQAAEPEPPAAPTSPDPGASPGQAAPEPPRADANRRANRARMNQGLRIWWNQPRYASALALGPELRKEFDTELEQHRTRRSGLMTQVQEARQAVAEALGAGDWEAASRHRQALADLMAEVSLLETGLMTAVLTRLEPEQRATIEDRFPGVLRRPWLVGGGPGGTGVPWSARRPPRGQRRQ